MVLWRQVGTNSLNGVPCTCCGLYHARSDSMWLGPCAHCLRPMCDLSYNYPYWHRADRYHQVEWEHYYYCSKSCFDHQRLEWLKLETSRLNGEPCACCGLSHANSDTMWVGPCAHCLLPMCDLVYNYPYWHRYRYEVEWQDLYYCSESCYVNWRHRNDDHDPDFDSDSDQYLIDDQEYITRP